MDKLQEGIEWLVSNWDAIPKSFKTDLRSDYSRTRSNIPHLDDVDHEVVLLLNRQKPSVEASYDFDEERIGVSKTGKIIWGFDSGCSCTSPWHDGYPECYNCSEKWKQFEVELKAFDEGAIEECNSTISSIRSAVNHG